MMRSVLLAAPVAAVFVPTANAGLVSGTSSVDFMQVASGFIDIENPGTGTFTDITSILSPPVGSFLDLQGVIPGQRAFLASLQLASAGTGGTRFDFDFEAESAAFETSALEFFFSGGRVDVSSPLAATVRLEGLFGGVGGGAAFLYVYGDAGPSLFFPSSDPVVADIELGAGDHTIAWGVLVDQTGGVADLEGSLSFTFVPAPGALALLGIATLVVRRRRRA